MRQVTLFIVLLMFKDAFLWAQDSTATASSSTSVPYISLVITGLVLLILFSGILVQARWKEKEKQEKGHKKSL